jgi:copper resistance protein B
MPGKRMNRIAAVVLFLGIAPAYAEEATTPAVDHSQMDHSQMGHGSMQGGSAPPDARDPHAYSGGLVFGPDRQLKLADEQSFHSLMIERLELVRTRDHSSGAYELKARYGRDYDRAVLKAEGEVEDGRTAEARTELFWSHAIAAYWDAQLGVRHDSGDGRPGRAWLAFGFEGLAPYWFEIGATGYVGDEGRSALRLAMEYELLLTQKWVLQPRIEASFYGKRDADLALGSGLSSTVAGLRLRYEIRREFAPYVGLEWAGKYGGTADYARAAGAEMKETRFVAGLRFWF